MQARVSMVYAGASACSRVGLFQSPQSRGIVWHLSVSSSAKCVSVCLIDTAYG